MSMRAQACMHRNMLIIYMDLAMIMHLSLFPLPSCGSIVQCVQLYGDRGRECDCVCGGDWLFGERSGSECNLVT